MPCTLTVRSVFSIGVTTLAASSDIIILPSLVTGGQSLREPSEICRAYMIPYTRLKRTWPGNKASQTIELLPHSCCVCAATHPFLDVFVGFAGPDAPAKPTKTTLQLWWVAGKENCKRNKTYLFTLYISHNSV